MKGAPNMPQNMDEKAVDYLAGQIWERVDGGPLRYWGEVDDVTNARYTGYVLGILAKERSIARGGK